jgi:hypothetical protein
MEEHCGSMADGGIRAAIASPADSVYDDDENAEPGADQRPKRKFDENIIQQRIEEDRERVSHHLLVLRTFS